jgi:hypothetical protein
MSVSVSVSMSVGWAARSHLPGHENESKTGRQISMQSPWHSELSVLKEDMWDAESGLSRVEIELKIANKSMYLGQFMNFEKQID